MAKSQARKKKINHHLSQDIINLEIQKSRLNLEKSTLIFNKGILLYFSFLLVGLVGIIQGYLTPSTLNLIILLGIFAFVVGAIPYIIVSKREEKKMNLMLELLKKGRKGISPLIATVLLIGFAVALGAVVMNWGKAQLQTSVCDGVDIDFEKINEVPQICQRGNSLEMLLTNTGKKTITGFKVVMIGGNKEESKFIEKSLAPADVGEVTVALPDTITFLRLVKVVPALPSEETEEGVEYCTENSIKVLKVPMCE